MHVLCEGILHGNMFNRNLFPLKTKLEAAVFVGNNEVTFDGTELLVAKFASISHRWKRSYLNTPKLFLISYLKLQCVVSLWECKSREVNQQGWEGGGAAKSQHSNEVTKSSTWGVYILCVRERGRGVELHTAAKALECQMKGGREAKKTCIFFFAFLFAFNEISMVPAMLLVLHSILSIKRSCCILYTCIFPSCIPLPCWLLSSP